MNGQIDGRSPSVNSGSRRGETGQQPAPSIGQCALDLPRPPLSLVLEPELDVFTVLQTPGPRLPAPGQACCRAGRGRAPCGTCFRPVSSAGESVLAA